MASPVSESRESTTLDSGCEQYGHFMAETTRGAGVSHRPRRRLVYERTENVDVASIRMGTSWHTPAERGVAAQERRRDVVTGLHHERPFGQAAAPMRGCQCGCKQ